MALRVPCLFVLATTALLWGGSGAANAGPAVASAGASWPAVPQQLAKDRIQPGSALEKLILANQDFKLLRADESHDKLPLPAWLRVYWRKGHPEGIFRADDPTGGYPLVLKEMHEWMLHHQDLLPGPDEETIPPGTPGKVVAGPNLRISGAQTTARSESDIRVNYWDGTKIIAASNNISASARQAQFWSTDSGATWGQTILPAVVGDAFNSDPTVDWNSSSTGWSTTLGINAAQTQLRLRVFSSADFGATWTFSATASGTQTQVDKQMVWVDHSASSPYQNNIYAIWHNGLPAFMNVRNAGTGLWGTPTQVSTAAGTGTQIGGDVKTNSAGHVFGFWPATGNRRVFVVKSTDGGGTYGAPVQITTTFDSFDIGVPAFNTRRLLIYVSGGAWRQTTINGTKDLVYASWTDLTGAAGCTGAANEPGANAASTCKTRIWFTRSTDGGATWEATRMINNQAGLNDQFNQWMVVDETTGQLAIIYQDTVADANRLCSHVYYQASFDDGANWTVPFQVSTAQTCEAAAGFNANQYGDYNGLSGYARNFFPSWTDRRNNAREEVWTAGLNDARTDVWSQDKTWDTGLEPDPATAANNMWESEDIWVRPDATAGPHVDPEAGSINYVHVNVRNKSASVPGENVPVKLYYAHASTGLAWPTDWTLIGTTVLPSVPVGLAPVDAVFQWTPPAAGHYCLIARLDTAQDPMTNAETADVNYNTRYNNNIAWRNVNVVDLVRTAVFKGSFILRNSFHKTGLFRLALRAQENERRETFLGRGGIQITLPTELVALLERQGLAVGGKGFKKIDGQTLQMAETQAEIWIPLDKRQEFTLGFRFEDTAPRTGITKETTPVRYTLEVIQETDRQQMEGGITYRIDAPALK